MSIAPPRQGEAGRQRQIHGPFPAAKAVEFQVVAIGVSAGRLEACKKLLDALPADNGMAFLIVQHLEPSRESLLVDLLNTQTLMRVVQATDGMEIERERIHIIPPGAYLSVDGKGSGASRGRPSDTPRGFLSTSC
jgi:two-component system CheB/CheR fusion protein